ncbi:MAG: TetM/TetW/TetO/TetS family tetracycline resistance ribosomal protection protein, partial [Clostridia bacterium]|nr:TetM/TetW/TetO/TetS family tetracycline resistance ribosomal protection protein [Clostridia bacterium]
MKKITVGILAHVDSGKTTLTEALLYCSGNIGKLGRVDHKNSYLDNDEMERKRGITIFSKQAILTYNNTEFTLLDTPGHIDFSAETERTLQVLDYAVLVISGTDGVQGHTHTLLKLLHRYHIPVFIYVNKMDLPHTHKTEILAQLKSTLNYDCTDFSQYIPKDDFFESIALCDESIFEEYSETGFVRDELIVQAIQKRKLFPCVFGSALKLDGIEYFLEILDKYTVMPDYGKTFAGKVFKVTQDKQGNRLTFVKITGGKLTVKDILPSEKNSNSEKVNQIRIYSGEKFKTIDTAESGTVCALTGITFTQCGDTLGAEKTTLMPLLQSVLTYTVILPENKDIRTVFHDLKLLEEQDPQLNILFNQQTNTIEIHLMGEIQQDIIQNMVRERFGYEIGFGKGNIIYKETIAKKVEGVGHFEPLRHYAEVHLLLEPSQRGSGITFKSDCSEDVLAKNWQRLIMTHLSEKIYTGVLTNSPLTDMTITLISGKAHTKHTEGGDFRQATCRAVRQGLMQAENILLEPVYEYRLEIPTENTGKAMSDIQSMHGTFTVDESNNGYTVLTGNVPVATMNEYHKEVTR